MTAEPLGLQKAPTGIKGFDEITNGGLPSGRPTLVTGAAGSGKTLFGIEFLVRGATEFDEPGVLLAFEERSEDLATNVSSLGFDLPQLERDGKLAVDAFRLDPAEYIESGTYDLEGLFIRLAAAVESVGAKRVVIDTIEVLFTALANPRHRARRAGPALPLAQGTRADSSDHERARGRGQPDPVRHRGVRLRLRGRPRPPRRSTRSPPAVFGW